MLPLHHRASRSACQAKRFAAVKPHVRDRRILSRRLEQVKLAATDMPQEYKLILKYADRAGLHARHRMLFAPRRLRGAEEGARHPAEGFARRQKAVAAGTNPRGREDLRPARPRRRGFFLRPEVELRGPQERQADLPDLQRRRIRAGHVQGPPDHPQGSAPVDRGHDHLVLRERREARLHLHPRRNARRREAVEPGA